MGNYTISGIDLFSFTENLIKKRIATKGVYHNKGYKIATDGFILVAVKDTYDNELEEKAIDKKGGIIEDIYPNWFEIVEKVKNIKSMKPVNLCISKFDAWVKQIKKKYANGCFIYPGLPIVSLYGILFTDIRYKQLIKGAKILGSEEIYINPYDNTLPVYIETDKGYCVAMPFPNLFNELDKCKDVFSITG